MKRVLMINAVSVNAENATGITLRSFLPEAESDSLMELHWSRYPLQPHMELNSVKLNYKKLSVGNLLVRLSKSQVNDSIKQSTEQTDGGKKGLLRFLRQYLALRLDTSGLKLGKADRKAISDFSPEVIYTLGASVNALRLAYRLSVQYDIPIVIHYMDNWLHSIQWEDNPLLRLYCRRLRTIAKKCRTRSDTGIAISPKMAEVYSAQTGLRYSFIMNSIDTAAYRCAPRPLGSSVRFVYAGGLHLGRDKSLCRVARTLAEVSARTGRATELCVYTSEENIRRYTDEFTVYPNIKLFPAVAHEKIRQVYETADVLLHTESTALSDNEFFRYSISTKIPEYLSSCRPVLFFGPAGIYLYEFFEKEALAFTASDEGQLALAVETLLSEPERRAQVTENAAAYAAAHFDRTAAKERFLSAVDSARLPGK